LLVLIVNGDESKGATIGDEPSPLTVAVIV
jgi:hypothetical protein